MQEVTGSRGGTPYQKALDLQRRKNPRTFVDPEAAAAQVRMRQLVGSRILQARTRLGLSQERLAMQVDASRTQLNSWERGRASVRPLSIERLCEATSEPVHYFYGGPPSDNHPRPAALDPIRALPALVELLLLYDRTSTLLHAVGRNGHQIDAQLQTLRDAGYFDVINGS